MKKLLALLLALVMIVGLFTACGDTTEKEDPAVDNKEETKEPASDDKKEDESKEEEKEEVVEPVYEDVDPADAVVHADFTSVYDMIGANVTIDMVTEDYDTGLAYIEYEGKTYEAGLDFLSMAMVYNCTPAGEYETSTDVYNQWWKLFIQRYNYMALEIPLYSNQYFDLYNAKFEGFVTSPYWAAADAIVATTIKEGNENSAILGSSTDLSGAFRNASWGKSSPGSSDLDIQNLTTGYATVQTDMSGAFIWNMKALAEVPTSEKTADGALTYTIKIKDDMVFSDGTPINAKNYVAGILANSTPVAVAAGGTGVSGLQVVGYEEFKAYTGEGETVYFEGIKLIDDYTFSVTFLPEYADYYFAMSYASFSPDPLALYLGENDVVVNEDGACGLSEGFYAMEKKDGVDTYVMADVINANLKWDSALPYSGPYVVSDYDESALIATLTLNPNYPGDDARGTASIETITYIKIVSETQTDMFKAGQVDVLAGITGGEETKAALALVEESPDKYAETHYDRAGYGFIGLRCDLGPVSDTAVRQAIMYTINRPEFAQTFTGGYGSVVHGPYYTGYSAYQAVEDEILLNQYAYSSDSAIAVLEEAGWIYNDKAQEFDPAVDAVRYKKLEGYELSEQNIMYATTDGAYKTLKINGEYYMPLAINWYGTQPNNVTDMLITAWQANPNATTAIGAYITYTSCDFATGLYGEYLQIEDYGWDGVAKCCGINYATGFTSAAYDMSWNFTINPDMYADYSRAYFMDEADFWENY